MGHDHSHGHHHHGSKNIAIAFFLNLGFTIIEFIGGFLTNSVAIQSDALHDLGDSLSLGVAWYFQRLSGLEKSSQFTFGYKRFNTLGALITGVVLLLGSVYVLSEAIPRLFYPENADSKGMILLAILGVLINGAAVLQVKKGDSLNEKMISWHLMEDVLGWVAVLIGALVMYATGLMWIDPVLSILITCYILYNVIKNLRDVAVILLQATPHHVETKQVYHEMSSIDDVQDVHHLHVWSLDGDFNLLSAHVVVEDTTTMDDIGMIRTQIKQRLEPMGINHITIEFEMDGNCAQSDIGYTADHALC